MSNRTRKQTKGNDKKTFLNIDYITWYRKVKEIPGEERPVNQMRRLNNEHLKSLPIESVIFFTFFPEPP